MGRNSVRPWTAPRTIASSRSIGYASPRARELRLQSLELIAVRGQLVSLLRHDFGLRALHEAGASEQPFAMGDELLGPGDLVAQARALPGHVEKLRGREKASNPPATSGNASFGRSANDSTTSSGCSRASPPMMPAWPRNSVRPRTAHQRARRTNRRARRRAPALRLRTPADQLHQVADRPVRLGAARPAAARRRP